jgi:hypothetical protein
METLLISRKEHVKYVLRVPKDFISTVQAVRRPAAAASVVFASLVSTLTHLYAPEQWLEILVRARVQIASVLLDK